MLCSQRRNPPCIQRKVGQSPGVTEMLLICSWLILLQGCIGGRGGESLLGIRVEGTEAIARAHHVSYMWTVESSIDFR